MTKNNNSNKKVKIDPLNLLLNKFESMEEKQDLIIDVLEEIYAFLQQEEEEFDNTEEIENKETKDKGTQKNYGDDEVVILDEDEVMKLKKDADDSMKDCKIVEVKMPKDNLEQ